MAGVKPAMTNDRDAQISICDDGEFNLSLVPHGMRNHISESLLHFLIEERIIEIVRPLRGRIVQNTFGCVRHS